MMRSRLFFLILISLLTIACNGPKSLTNKGNKFSESGIHSEAVNYYIKALSKKASYVDALIGLRNSSKMLLTTYSSDFFKAFTTGDNKTAVYSYLKMQDFVERVNSYNAELRIQPNYTEDFEEAKKAYLKSRFEEANDLISEEKFKEANGVFEEIETIEPDFEGKNFEALKEMALLEPYYRDGKKHIANNKNRNAYFAFKFICDNNINYKDAKYKMEESLEKAQYSIGLLKFENYSNDPAVSEYIATTLTQEIIDSKNPFIQLIDRTLTEKVIREQMMTYEGITNGAVTVKVGELIGAKALLSGSVLKVTKKSQQAQPTKKKAYLAKKVKKYDAVNKKNYYETSYDKTEYLEYYGYNEVTISFKFQLVSSETGQILTSDVIDKTLRDEVNYATYSGDYKSLVPGTWKYINAVSSEDKIDTKSNAQRQLKNLFTAKSKLVAPSQLQNAIEKEIAKMSANKILSFNPED